MSKPICKIVAAQVVPDPESPGGVAMDIRLHGGAEFRFLLCEAHAKDLASELLLAVLHARLRKGGGYAY